MTEQKEKIKVAGQTVEVTYDPDSKLVGYVDHHRSSELHRQFIIDHILRDMKKNKNHQAAKDRITVLLDESTSSPPVGLMISRAEPADFEMLKTAVQSLANHVPTERILKRAITAAEERNNRNLEHANASFATKEVQPYVNAAMEVLQQAMELDEERQAGYRKKFETAFVQARAQSQSSGYSGGVGG